MKDNKLIVLRKTHVRFDGVSVLYGVFKRCKTVFGMGCIVQTAVRNRCLRKKNGKFHADIVANRRKDFNSGCKIFINSV